MSQYSEEEQIALIKDWWSRNGKPLMFGVILALALIFGWQTWQKQQHNRTQQMSAAYQQLLQAAFAEPQADLDEVAKLLKVLEETSADNSYTQYARLTLAKVALEHERFADAVEQLRMVVDKPASEILGELAVHRLARVLIIQGEQEQALALLEQPGLASYQPARDELRGDILLMLERPELALKAYRKAMGDATDSAMLQMKIDDLSQKDA